MRRARILVLAGLLVAALASSAPAAGGSPVVGSANGGSVLDIHNLFGLELIEAQPFSFRAELYAGGTVSGVDLYRTLGEPGADETTDMTTLIGAGGPGEAQDYCDRAPEPRFPFVLDHGEIQVRDFG